MSSMRSNLVVTVKVKALPSLAIQLCLPESTLLLLDGLKVVVAATFPRPVLRLLKGLFSLGLKNRRCVWGGVAAQTRILGSLRPLLAIASIPSALLPLGSF